VLAQQVHLHLDPLVGVGDVADLAVTPPVHVLEGRVEVLVGVLHRHLRPAVVAPLLRYRMDLRQRKPGFAHRLFVPPLELLVGFDLLGWELIGHLITVYLIWFEWFFLAETHLFLLLLEVPGLIRLSISERQLFTLYHIFKLLFVQAELVILLDEVAIFLANSLVK
jgi:hypothetical protein